MRKKVVVFMIGGYLVAAAVGLGVTIYCFNKAKRMCNSATKWY